MNNMLCRTSISIFPMFNGSHMMSTHIRTLSQLTFLCLLVMCTACSNAQTVLNVKDFGAIGDGVNDDLPAFNKALEAVRTVTSRPVTLRIPDGTYRLALDESAKIKSHLHIESQSDLTVTGDKQALLLVGSPYHMGVGIFKSKNVTVKNLAVDYELLPYTQGIITTVDPEAQLITIRVDPGYPLPTDKHIDAFASKKGHNVGSLYDPDTNLRCNEYFSQYLRKQVEDLGDGLYRYKSSNVVKQSMVGKRFAVVGRRKASAFQVDASRDCLLENVTAYSAPSCGYNVSSSSGITIDKSKIMHRPDVSGAPRAMSTNADGLHSKWCPVGHTLSNSSFTGMGDDSVNIGGSYTPVLQKLDDRTIVVQAHGSITNYPTDLIMATPGHDQHLKMPKLLKWNGIKVEGYNKHCLMLTFDAPLPELVTWKQTNHPRKCSQVLNLNACGRYAKVINNHFFNHRVRGILMRGPDSLIKGNRIENMSGPAIVVSNDGGFLTEGPCGDNTIIEDNVMSNIERSDIYIASSLAPKVRGLIIRNNKIENYGGDDPYGRGINGNPFYISKGADIVIENNTITNPNPGYEKTPILYHKNLGKITWKNNSINGRPLDLQKDAADIPEKK
ncbi:MAG TPA: hypothetical protein DER01_13695 [Phycisphaerales bacterium]|nr:hypothetical protein [Phycisphaerales bacterium]